MAENARYALILWVCAALCGVALAYQLRSGRGLDWFGMEVTRTKTAALYWVYVFIAAGCMIFTGVIGAALFVG